MAQTPDGSPVPTVQPQQIQPDAERIAVLQAQMELMRDYHEKILDTVYWSLGGLAGVVLLVVGLGWYTNFRIYKREVEDIKKAVESNIRLEIIEIAKQESRGAIRELTSALKELNYEKLEIKAEEWKVKKVYENVIRTYTKMISLAIEDDKLLGESVGLWSKTSKILDNLSKLLKSEEFSISPETTANLLKALNNIPKDFSIDVENIIGLSLFEKI